MLKCESSCWPVVYSRKVGRLTPRVSGISSGRCRRRCCCGSLRVGSAPRGKSSKPTHSLSYVVCSRWPIAKLPRSPARRPFFTQIAILVRALLLAMLPASWLTDDSVLFSRQYPGTAISSPTPFGPIRPRRSLDSPSCPFRMRKSSSSLFKPTLPPLFTPY